jgi:hypothetical protein
MLLQWRVAYPMRRLHRVGPLFLFPVILPALSEAEGTGTHLLCRVWRVAWGPV